MLYQPILNITKGPTVNEQIMNSSFNKIGELENPCHHFVFDFHVGRSRVVVLAQNVQCTHWELLIHKQITRHTKVNSNSVSRQNNNIIYPGETRREECYVCLRIGFDWFDIGPIATDEISSGTGFRRAITYMYRYSYIISLFCDWFLRGQLKLMMTMSSCFNVSND